MGGSKNCSSLTLKLEVLLTTAAGDKVARRACLGWLWSPNLKMGFPGDLHRDDEPLIAS